jgi:hypothetical protein
MVHVPGRIRLHNQTPTRQTNPADGPSRRPDYDDEPSSTDNMEWMPSLQNKMARSGPDTMTNPIQVTVQAMKTRSQKTYDLEPRILRRHADQMVRHEEAYAPDVSVSFREDILKIQAQDPRTRHIKEKVANPANTCVSKSWYLFRDADGQKKVDHHLALGVSLPTPDSHILASRWNISPVPVGIWSNTTPSANLSLTVLYQHCTHPSLSGPYRCGCSAPLDL